MLHLFKLLNKLHNYKLENILPKKIAEKTGFCQVVERQLIFLSDIFFFSRK